MKPIENNYSSEMRLVRRDLMSKSHFSKAYNVPRCRIDSLIATEELPVECIDGTDYINIADEKLIQHAIRIRKSNGLDW